MAVSKISCILSGFLALSYTLLDFLDFIFLLQQNNFNFSPVKSDKAIVIFISHAFYML